MNAKPYFKEAANTLKAKPWMLFLARVFGTKILQSDGVYLVEMRRFLGVTYFIGMKKHEQEPRP